MPTARVSLLFWLLASEAELGLSGGGGKPMLPGGLHCSKAGLSNERPCHTGGRQAHSPISHSIRERGAYASGGVGNQIERANKAEKGTVRKLTHHQSVSFFILASKTVLPTKPVLGDERSHAPSHQCKQPPAFHHKYKGENDY